jgi:hypothetical protein
MGEGDDLRQPQARGGERADQARLQRRAVARESIAVAGVDRQAGNSEQRLIAHVEQQAQTMAEDRPRAMTGSPLAQINVVVLWKLGKFGEKI